MNKKAITSMIIALSLTMGAVYEVTAPTTFDKAKSSSENASSYMKIYDFKKPQLEKQEVINVANNNSDKKIEQTENVKVIEKQSNAVAIVEKQDNTTVRHEKSSRSSDVNVNRIESYAVNASKKYNIPSEIIMGVISTETGGTFNTRLISDTQDYGLTQWNKPSGTFEWLREQVAIEMGIPKSDVKWDNPEHNIVGGVWYLNWLKNYWISKGSTKDIMAKTLLSYNMGIGNANNYLKHHSPYEWSYVKKVYDLAEEYK